MTLIPPNPAHAQHILPLSRMIAMCREQAFKHDRVSSECCATLITDPFALACTDLDWSLTARRDSLRRDSNLQFAVRPPPAGLAILRRRPFKMVDIPGYQHDRATIAPHVCHHLSRISLHHPEQLECHDQPLALLCERFAQVGCVARFTCISWVGIGWRINSCAAMRDSARHLSLCERGPLN